MKKVCVQVPAKLDNIKTVVTQKKKRNEKNNASFRRNSLNKLMTLYFAKMSKNKSRKQSDKKILSQLKNLSSKKKNSQRWTIQNVKNLCRSQEIGQIFRASFKTFLDCDTVKDWIKDAPRKKTSQSRYENLVAIIKTEIDSENPFFLFSATQQQPTSTPSEEQHQQQKLTTPSQQALFYEQDIDYDEVKESFNDCEAQFKESNVYPKYI